MLLLVVLAIIIDTMGHETVQQRLVLMLVNYLTIFVLIFAETAAIVVVIDRCRCLPMRR